MPRIIHSILRTYTYICIYTYIYICIYLASIVYSLRPVDAVELEVGGLELWLTKLEVGAVKLEVGFMRHGHEMLWFSRWSFSESELPLSYNAKVTNARRAMQLIASEINLLNKV